MKKSVLILILGLFLVGVFATTYKISTVGADSGFDSSFDSDFSSDYGDSSSDGDLFFLIYLIFEHPILALIIIVIIIIVSRSNSKKQKEFIDKALNDNKLELLNVNNFNEEEKLGVETFNIYKTVQYAWMNFDEETIRNNVTDEMYNMYLMQLDTLKVKNQKNIMYDIKYLGSRIIKKYEENGQETIVINMDVSCYDFIIDTTNNKIVRGNASKLNVYSYEITFVRTTNKKEMTICPSCGAPIEGNNSGTCEYCKATLISNNYTLIMSKKKMLSQK